MLFNKILVGLTILFLILLSSCIVNQPPVFDKIVVIIEPNESIDRLLGPLEPLGVGEGTKFSICDDSTATCIFNVTDTGNVEIANNISTVNCIIFDNGGKVGPCG